MKPITWGILLLIFGALLLLQNFDVLDMGDVISTCWPILLIYWGWRILQKHRAPAPPPASASPGAPSAGGSADAASADGTILHESHLFDNMYTRVGAQRFKGGSVSTVFGTSVIDLSDAIVADGEHLFTLHSVFGDARLVLPPGLAYTLTVNTVLGKVWLLGNRRGGFASEVRHTTDGYATAAAKLAITVSKIFGDLIIEQKS